MAGAVERVIPLASPIAIDGGMSANPYFLQFLADALGRDLRVAAAPEVTACGAGLLAAEAVGNDVGEAPPPQEPGQYVTANPLPAGTRERFAAAVAAVAACAAAG